jgi:hypothetical protein
VKHLSTPRKGDYSLSSGERKGKSLNLMSLVVLEPTLMGGCKADETRFRTSQRVTNRTLAKGLWKGPPQKVTVR